MIGKWPAKAFRGGGHLDITDSERGKHVDERVGDRGERTDTARFGPLWALAVLASTPLHQPPAGVSCSISKHSPLRDGQIILLHRVAMLDD